jgi:hypothetical protein
MPGRGPLWKTAIAQALGASLGFPQWPTTLGKRCAFPTFPQRRRFFFFSSQKQHRKDPKPINPHHGPSGSFFDEKMLGHS